MQRKRYHLVRGEAGPRVYVLDDGPVRVLDPRADLDNILPLRFDWGAPSNRALRLALAMLADWTRDGALALGLANAFMLEFIATFHASIGGIEGSDIQGWLNELEAADIDTYALL